MPDYKKIKYQNGYKYKLYSRYKFQTQILNQSIITQEYSLSPDGMLVIGKSYVWNGVTNWIDSKETMRATLIHDVLYQMMQEGQLDISYKSIADSTLYDILIEDGVHKIVAKLMYYAVKKFGKTVIKQGNSSYLEAP